jgi:hypothetical protein
VVRELIAAKINLASFAANHVRKRHE